MRYSNLQLRKDIKNRTYLSLFNINIPTSRFEFRNIKYNNERLDYLSDKYYDDGQYWWVISLFNKITNPLKINLEYIKIPINVEEVVNYVIEESQ